MQIAIDVNGRLGDEQSASVSVLDRGFLFGEGVYETLRTYNRQPFLLDRHLARLRASAERIALEPPLDDTAFATRIRSTMQAVDTPGERSIRLLLTRGAGELSYDLANCPPPTVVIIVRPHPEIPADVVETRHRRGPVFGHAQPPALAEPPDQVETTCSTMPSRCRRRYGPERARALMCNHRGELAECAQSNFFLVRGGLALTPAPRRGHPGGRYAQLRLRGGCVGGHRRPRRDTAARESRHRRRAVRDQHDPGGARGHAGRSTPRRRWATRTRDAGARGRVPPPGARMTTSTVDALDC